MFPKRGAIALVTTVLALILLLSFKTPDAISLPGGTTAVADATSVPSTTTAPSTTTTGPTPPPTIATASATVTGSTIATPYGDVAVAITVTDGQVTGVRAVALPTRGRSGEISNYVSPILASEALQAQSASIDVVSGATYTSRAYARSLQSALDQAGIASVSATG